METSLQDEGLKQSRPMHLMRDNREVYYMTCEHALSHVVSLVFFVVVSHVKLSVQPDTPFRLYSFSSEIEE